jgi:ubiquitin C-terminal hydrolase
VNEGFIMQAYLQPEKLEEDDKWYCNKCKEHVQADKKLDFWQAPEVLVVHLKRFCFSRSMRDKLTAEVDFPLRGLDLSPYVIKEQARAPPFCAEKRWLSLQEP